MKGTRSSNSADVPSAPMVEFSQRAQRRSLAFVVLAAVLFGAVSAGTPVVGDDSVAAVTAGISLSTEALGEATHRSAEVIADLAHALEAAPVGPWLFVVAMLVLVALGRGPSWSLGVVRTGGPSRRGPPPA